MSFKDPVISQVTWLSHWLIYSWSSYSFVSYRPAGVINCPRQQWAVSFKNWGTYNEIQILSIWLELPKNTYTWVTCTSVWYRKFSSLQKNFAYSFQWITTTPSTPIIAALIVLHRLILPDLELHRIICCPSFFRLLKNKKYHGLGGLNNKHYFSQFWRVGIQDQGTDSTSDKDLLPGPLLAVSFCGRKKDGELSRVSFIRALTPFMGAPPSWLNHLLKTPTSKYHHTGA